MGENVKVKALLPFYLIPRHDVSLLQGFDGVQAARLSILRQQHLNNAGRAYYKPNLCALIVFLSTTNEKCSNTGLFFILLGKLNNKYLPKVASAENGNHFEVLQGKRASAGSEREKYHKTIKT